MEMDQADPRPAYQRVADDLRRAIAGGTYGPGDQLPTLAEITGKYGIAVMTARDAIRQLVSEGLVVSRQGKGAYVLRQPNAEDTITVTDLLKILTQVSESVDDLTDRMTAVERKLADRERSDAAQESSADG